MVVMHAWVNEELRTAAMGDKRLDNRFAALLGQLSDQPTQSIPVACGERKEAVAGYRFFDNEKVDGAKVLQPHINATRERCRTHSVVLAIQDTTEVDLTRKQEKVGGPLNKDTRWGLYVHPVLAVTPERVPLGVLDAEIWNRDPVEFAQSAAEKKKQRRLKPIEEKESYRWLEGYRVADKLAKDCPQTRVINVADSEADIYDIYAEASAAAQPPAKMPPAKPATGRKAAKKSAAVEPLAKALPAAANPVTEPRADFIVRSCHEDRQLHETEKNLRQILLCMKPIGRMTIEVSKRDTSPDSPKRKKPRSARQAQVTIRATRTLLEPPDRQGDKKLPPVWVNAVLVLEEKPPEGEEPIEWLLLTSLPIATADEVHAVIDYYCVRWQIEIYFRVLKSGCQIEKLQLEKTERVLPCLAMYMIVAWRIMHVTMLSRTCPEMPCDEVLEEAEWKAVYLVVMKKPAPVTPPTLEELVELIAQLGGYQGRKQDGPPGPKAMWIGMQRMRDFATAYECFGPGRTPP
jgi:transposase Tn5 family protein/transposase-like protein